LVPGQVPQQHGFVTWSLPDQPNFMPMRQCLDLRGALRIFIDLIVIEENEAVVLVPLFPFIFGASTDCRLNAPQWIAHRMEIIRFDMNKNARLLENVPEQAQICELRFSFAPHVDARARYPLRPSSAHPNCGMPP
jgi:hypothetical protein